MENEVELRFEHIFIFCGNGETLLDRLQQILVRKMSIDEFKVLPLSAVILTGSNVGEMSYPA